MRLHPEPFEKINSGTKTIEMRVDDEKEKNRGHFIFMTITTILFLISLLFHSSNWHNEIMKKNYNHSHSFSDLYDHTKHDH